MKKLRDVDPSSVVRVIKWRRKRQEQLVKHVGRREMHEWLRSGKLKEKVYLEDLGTDGRTLLE
jgi:hypothetical protein